MKQAMIFAAGMGTRLKPLTDTMPKALVRVGGQPLLWHVLMKLKAAGFGRIVVNVHHFAQQIIDYLAANDHFGIDIRISDERAGLLETGGGIRKALPLLDAGSPVLIHNVDILSNADLGMLYELADRSADDALLLVSRRATRRYLLFDERQRLCGWTNTETGEVKSPWPALAVAEMQRLAFSGIHVLKPGLFAALAEMPARFGIIDFYLEHCRRHAIGGHAMSDLRLMDVGKLDTLEQAETFIKHL